MVKFEPETVNRRAFVTRSATATVGAALLTSRLRQIVIAKGEYKLKSEAQFRKEASQYGSAMQLLRAAVSVKTDEELAELLPRIEQATHALRFQLSSFVIMGISSRSLRSAVKNRITDQRALESFVQAGVKDLETFLRLDGAAEARQQMLKTALEDRAVVIKVIERLQRLGKVPPETAEAAEAVKQAEEAAQCAKVYCIVVAVIIVIIAIVIAATTFGAAGSAGWIETNMIVPMSRKYGPDLSDLVFERAHDLADARYARCTAVTKTPSKAEWITAKAKCQALWLKHKAQWLIAA